MTHSLATGSRLLKHSKPAAVGRLPGGMSRTHVHECTGEKAAGPVLQVGKSILQVPASHALGAERQANCESKQYVPAPMEGRKAAESFSPVSPSVSLARRDRPASKEPHRWESPLPARPGRKTSYGRSPLPGPRRTPLCRSGMDREGRSCSGQRSSPLRARSTDSLQQRARWNGERHTIELVEPSECVPRPAEQKGQTGAHAMLRRGQPHLLHS